MPRYQFTARAHTYGALTLSAVRDIIKTHGGSNPREAFPIMLASKQHGRGGPGAAIWRGTNQPRTIAFTAPDDETAARICEAFDSESWFVWNIDARQYAVS
jgi:hypothetical protein